MRLPLTGHYRGYTFEYYVSDQTGRYMVMVITPSGEARLGASDEITRIDAYDRAVAFVNNLLRKEK